MYTHPHCSSRWLGLPKLHFTDTTFYGSFCINWTKTVTRENHFTQEDGSEVKREIFTLSKISQLKRLEGHVVSKTRARRGQLENTLDWRKEKAHGFATTDCLRQRSDKTKSPEWQNKPCHWMDLGGATGWLDKGGCDVIYHTLLASEGNPYWELL